MMLLTADSRYALKVKGLIVARYGAARLTFVVPSRSAILGSVRIDDLRENHIDELVLRIH
jgi:hypothetical protein